MDRRLFLGGLAGVLAGPAAAQTLVRVGGPAFGSSWRLVADTEVPLARLRAAVADVVAATDAAMSPWRPDSEVARFNRAGAGVHRVTEPLCRVTQLALDTCAATGGAFDPTVGPLVRRYGWGPVEGRFSAGAVAVTGGALVKADPAATLDLCGVAKGDALDRAVAALTAAGLRHVLVEMGGEVRAVGRQSSGRDWQVAIAAPDGGVQRIVAPGARALATSGLMPNGFETGPMRTSHIVDPRTGRPVRGRVGQVSVAAGTAAEADAWATALLVLGDEAGPATAERRGLAALFLIHDRGIWREIMAAGFADMVVA